MTKIYSIRNAVASKKLEKYKKYSLAEMDNV